jgi:hypothetical protein
VRIESDSSDGPHGPWSYFRVAQRGLTPVLLYETSSTGPVLPKGMSGSPLCDQYDPKEFMTYDELSRIQPVSRLEITRLQR